MNHNFKKGDKVYHKHRKIGPFTVIRVKGRYVFYENSKSKPYHFFADNLELHKPSIVLDLIKDL